MAKLKHDRSADCVVVGYLTHKTSKEAVGSLLLAVYADEGRPRQEWEAMFDGLMPIGVAASFPETRRKELFTELAPYAIEMDEHPWARAKEKAAAYPGSRWNPDKDLSFTHYDPNWWLRSGSANWTMTISAILPSSSAGDPTATLSPAGLNSSRQSLTFASTTCSTPEIP